MMDLSIRSLPRFGVLLIAVIAVSCDQPGAGDAALPTAPSSLSVGPSAAFGPGASYDASGVWRFVSTDVQGNPIEGFETFDANVTQDANGNLSFLADEDELVTLVRLGTGVIITYRFPPVADDEEGVDCKVLARGTGGRLDTRTNTLTINFQFRELGCSHFRLGPVVLTATKLS